jgi:hypothetical protein
VSSNKGLVRPERHCQLAGASPAVGIAREPRSRLPLYPRGSALPDSALDLTGARGRGVVRREDRWTKR